MARRSTPFDWQLAPIPRVVRGERKRISVYRGVRMRRHRLRGNSRLPQYPSCRLRKRDKLPIGYWVQARAQYVQRFGMPQSLLVMQEAIIAQLVCHWSVGRIDVV
jgi:hypothetical protein